MRIYPKIPNFRCRDYKIKQSPKEVLFELRDRCEFASLRKYEYRVWFHRKMPTKGFKIHIGPIVPFIPKYEWNKLQYRFGKMTKVKGELYVSRVSE